MAPINLMELNESDFKQFLDSFDHVFSDCDGVIWIKESLPGSGQFFDLMKKREKTVDFVSNNSIRTKAEYEKKFQDAGIHNGFKKLTIPSIAIAEYLKDMNFKKTVYCVCCLETQKMLESYGFSCKGGPDIADANYENFSGYLIDDEKYGAVVFDNDFQINLAKLFKAQAYLTRPDVLFICGATDKDVPTSDGVITIGPGVFTELVAEHANRSPVQIGKPGRVFGEFAMKRAGVTDPSRVLFIGDMIDQDVGLGKATGFKTMLVLTKNSEDKMMKHHLKPDFYAPSLGSLVKRLIRIVK